MFVVSGGGSGIGRALALALASRGKEVLIVGRRLSLLQETAASSPLISFCASDLSTSEGRTKLLSLLAKQERLEGLVHNAGTIDPIAPIATIKEQDWQRALDLNLNAPLFLTQSLLGKLTQGRVLHMGSAVAYFPIAAWAAYCTSKAALSMLTRCWQLESKEVAFASVMPGIIDTDMQALIRQSNSMAENNLQFYKTLKQENRLLMPATVACFLTWLLLDVPRDEYAAQEWDIYDTAHHASWLQAPHTVPSWE